MTQYSMAQVAQLWLDAGGAGGEVEVIAVSVAWAESGGADNKVGAAGEIGLWQILPANLNGMGFNPSQVALDATLQAKAAVQFSANGSNWAPWSTAWEPAQAPNYNGQLAAPVAGSYAAAEEVAVSVALGISGTVSPGPAPVNGPPPPTINPGAGYVSPGGTGQSGISNAWAAFADLFNAFVPGQFGELVNINNLIIGDL